MWDPPRGSVPALKPIERTPPLFGADGDLPDGGDADIDGIPGSNLLTGDGPKDCLCWASLVLFLILEVFRISHCPTAAKSMLFFVLLNFFYRYPIPV